MLPCRLEIPVLAALFALMAGEEAAQAGKIRILTKVINPVYHRSGKEGPPVRFIQNVEPVKPRTAPRDLPVSPAPSPKLPELPAPAPVVPATNSTPAGEAAPDSPQVPGKSPTTTNQAPRSINCLPTGSPHPTAHHEPYPFAFNQFDRYPGGYFTHRYPGGYYQGGYRYPAGYPYYATDYPGWSAPRIYGAAPLPYDPVVYGNGGLLPAYAPLGYGYGYGLGGYFPYGFSSGIYTFGPGLGYRFGPVQPTYAVGASPLGVAGYVPAPAGAFIGNPYYGATQWEGLTTETPADAPLYFTP